MDRLQKKCFVASAGFHALLAGILFVGPGFLSSRTTTPDVQVLDFIPSKLIDAAMTGGGNPAPKMAATPAPQPPQPAAQPPPPQPKPQPVETTREIPKQVQKEVADPDSLQINERRQPQISLKRVVRKSAKDSTKSDAKAQSQAERQLADARRRAANQLSRAAEEILQGTSSATTIEEVGPGGGGPAYASYSAWVLTVFDNAWIAPDNATLPDAITRVKVTIARDGTVLSKEIIERSGDAQMDASVRRALERVSSIGKPFPEGAKEKERTYIIPFNLKAKLGTA